jgi:hypothetical protein
MARTSPHRGGVAPRYGHGGSSPTHPVGPFRARFSSRGTLRSRPSAPPEPGAPRASRVRSVVAIGAAAVILATLVTLVIVLAPVLLPGGKGSSGPGPPSSPAAESCSSLAGAPPDALYIPVRGPNLTLPNGGEISVAYQVRAVANGTPSPEVAVEMPSAFAVFPLVGAPSIEVYLQKRALTLPEGTWSAAGLVTAQRPVSGSVSFATNESAFLTTELLAVMSPAPFGSVSLSFRWAWNVTPTGENPVPGPWTVPTTGGAHPSEFPPVPYVGLAGGTGTTATIGQNFTAYLTGAISNQTFVVKLENATTGLNLRVVDEAAPLGNSTPFPVSIPILAQDGELSPGNYLVHIHDTCHALLYNLPVRVYYAAQAIVGFAVLPSSCGPIEFNGVSFANGRNTTVVPSPNGIAVAAPACAGHSFSGWASSGGIAVANLTSASTAVVVSANGGLTARYN